MMKKIFMILLNLLLISSVSCSTANETIPSVIRNKAKKATVYVSFDNGTCTGVLIADKTVLTAKHCTSDSIKVNGIRVEYYTTSDERDIAILYLKYKLNFNKHVKIADKDVFPGEVIFNWGYPNIFIRYVEGRALFKGTKYHVSNLGVLHGHSGGGVFNSQGELIGIMVYGVFEKGKQNKPSMFSGFVKLSDLNKFILSVKETK